MLGIGFLFDTKHDVTASYVEDRSLFEKNQNKGEL